VEEAEPNENNRRNERDANAGPMPAHKLGCSVSHGVTPRGDGLPRSVTPEVIEQGLGRGVPSLRLLAEGFEKDHVQIAA
jgi:hypothetical protein